MPIEDSTPNVTRRAFLGQSTAATLLAGMTRSLPAEPPANRPAPQSPASTFLDILRYPNRVTAYAQLTEPQTLSRAQSEWRGSGIEVDTSVASNQVAINVHAPGQPLRYLHLRWDAPVDTSLQILGDAWERSYGDLGWRNLIPERVLPWYFATRDGAGDGAACHAYGVKTGARVLCFWQLDPEGVSLWLNLSNGGSGVNLGDRTLAAAVVTARQGSPGDGPNAALQSFCRRLCAQPSRPAQPIYGTNDWYYAYGKNTAKQILDDTDFVARLTSENIVRPFSVIDMGWDAGPPAFPSMSELAAQIRQRNLRPGIWIRPLLAPAGSPASLLLPATRFGEQQDRASELAWDPTIPEAREKILEKVRQVVDWDFELVKHDFSTYDLLGRWGFEMGAEPTHPGWHLNDQTRTNAEVILDLYQHIREAARPGTLILGCNTIGHLGQSFFDAQRTGDDTSGRQWERTRRMGINTLAFRLPQHNTFFVQDADCVGLSADVPWKANRQWLDLLAHTGTALFISPGEGSRRPEQAQAIRQAFQLAAAGGDAAQPADPTQESTPQTWKTATGAELNYNWSTTTGAWPFPV